MAAATFDKWEGTQLEKDLTCVVLQLPPERLGSKQECPVCLTAVVGSLVSWVLFPCNHGVCARCFELLVESQVRRPSHLPRAAQLVAQVLGR